ncbi:MAG: hypothetical protein OEZ08_08385, partial [Betaproteobacteria bacterium]|nr:hypothetical protein [Betaproteobacteria bacterium]
REVILSVGRESRAVARDDPGDYYEPNLIGFQAAERRQRGAPEWPLHGRSVEKKAFKAPESAVSRVGERRIDLCGNSGEVGGKSARSHQAGTPCRNA